MKIATWNVNSIRSRLVQVVDWLQVNPVDVLCLQETKVIDAQFPRSPFVELGYQLYISGQKAYNGVAILSRTPLTEVTAGFTPLLADSLGERSALDGQKRLITGIVSPGIRIVNVYVPNGAAVGGEKYSYKLDWLNTLHAYLNTLVAQPAAALVVCGDINIALEDRDIHNPQGRENQIMASGPERQALREILDLGFRDGFRKFSAEGGQFSWWDYRAGSFRQNKGWRIDHHYLTSQLYDRAIACTIDSGPRRLPKPSDHAPVIVELDLASFSLN